MTIAELRAALETLKARHQKDVDAYKAAVAAYDAEHGRIVRAISAAEQEEQRERVKRRLAKWPEEVLDLLRQPQPPRRYSDDWAPLARRKLVKQVGPYVVRWTPDAAIARELLGVVP